MTATRDQLLDLLMSCPAESVYWAGIGYSLAVEDHEAWRAGYAAAEHAMERAWASAAAPIRRVLEQPTYAELERRRGAA